MSPQLCVVKEMADEIEAFAAVDQQMAMNEAETAQELLSPSLEVLLDTYPTIKKHVEKYTNNKFLMSM